MVAVLADVVPEEVDYAPRGSAIRLMECRDEEILVDGPAGTGKTLACLAKLHGCALKYPNMRGLMVRKTLTSLTGSAVVTFREHILAAGSWGVREFSGSHFKPAQFIYPNGSVIVVGGMDNAQKIMSSEYDLVVANEATELTEDDWESITSRLRHGVMPYQQLIGDTNPGSPTHWLNQRCDAGTTTRLLSRHEDNPRYWDAARGEWTAEGRAYVLGTLDRLTGVRRDRLRFGRWVAAEGVVYEGWDPAVHVVDRFDIPTTWPRYLAIDFGYTNPFAALWFAQDEDGRLYRYREIYLTGRLVEDHARQIHDAMRGEPRLRAIVCDHDAEGRATLKRHLGMPTTAAQKVVQDGIQAVAARLKVAADGKPRLFFLRDSLVERDPALTERRLPACTEEEFDTYVWDTSSSRKRGEEPVKANDHGLDAARYLVAHFDLRGAPVPVAPAAVPGLVLTGRRPDEWER